MPSTLSERWGTIRSYSFLAFLAMHVIFVPLDTGLLSLDCR